MASHYLITGAGRGIGRGLSRLLLQRGKRVLLVDVNREELDHIVEDWSRQYTRGVEFETIIGDLRSPPDICNIAEIAGKFFGDRLDVLINNAADTRGVGTVEFSELPLDLWEATLQTNLTAPMLLSQRCLKLLRRPATIQVSSKGDAMGLTSGCIINVSSTRAFMSESNNEAYSATKAGLLGLTQAMSVSLAATGVRVNAILPGWIHVANECKEADEYSRPWEEGLNPQDHAWHLSGRVGKVEDVLQAVDYLVQSDFVTGAEVVVDGGVTRKMVYPE